MIGPKDKWNDDSVFDLNHDGEIDSAEWLAMNDTFFEDKHGISSGVDDEDEEKHDKFSIFGLDRLDLEMMDEDERREALEDAGLDPDDYKDEF